MNGCSKSSRSGPTAGEFGATARSGEVRYCCRVGAFASSGIGRGANCGAVPSDEALAGRKRKRSTSASPSRSCPCCTSRIKSRIIRCRLGPTPPATMSAMSRA